MRRGSRPFRASHLNIRGAGRTSGKSSAAPRRFAASAGPRLRWLVRLCYPDRVKPSAKSRRRWFGGLCLLGALVMLLAGQTRPGGELTGVAFILYWLLCLVLTLLAMIAALLDAFALRQENRKRQRALIESTLQEIQTRRRRPPGNDSRSAS